MPCTSLEQVLKNYFQVKPGKRIFDQQNTITQNRQVSQLDTKYNVPVIYLL